MEEEKKDASSAIADRRDQVKAFDRPEKLSDTDIASEVQLARETADTFKVYVPEWVIMFTSKAPHAEGGQAEAEAFFATKYEGRVEDTDVRYEPASRVFPDKFPTRLFLRLPNVKGEFKTKLHADDFVEKSGLAEAQVVARNSRNEHKLKDYGIKKLLKK